MRHIIALSLILSTGAIAQDCDETNIHVGPFPKSCDNIYINADYTVPFGLTQVIELNLVPGGVVDIKRNVTLNGEDGTLLSTPGDGGQGGPGAGAGGGVDIFETAENGQGGFFAPGKAAPQTPLSCGGGGGGAGMSGPGYDGTVCNSNPDLTSFGEGGQDATSTGDFSFTSSDFKGGFGGGAGGKGDTKIIGAGGGGGGGLYINAASSDIIIRSGVTISAQGGKGGPATNDGGGGGGGSGGAIWLKTTGNIINAGTINLSGGEGGTNTATNAKGGSGAPGMYRLEDSSGVQEGSGFLYPPASPAPGGIAEITNFKSGIACSSVQDKHDGLVFQIVGGFFLAGIIRALFRYLRSVSKKIAFRH